MGRAVNAQGQSGHHHPASLGGFLGKLARQLQAVGRGVAGADYGQRGALQLLALTGQEQSQRRVGTVEQLRRVVGMVRGEDMRLASRLMVLTGSVGAIMQTPVGQNMAALAGL